MLTIQTQEPAYWQSHTYTHPDKNIKQCFILDNRTGNVFNSDPKIFVWVKCLGLTFLTPFATVIRTVAYIAKTIFYGLSCLTKSLFSRDVNHDWKYLKEGFEDIFINFYCCLNMVGSAIYGLVDPFEGRNNYGMFERYLNRQPNVDDINFREKSYLAACFQPITHTGSEKYNEKLKKYVERLNC